METLKNPKLFLKKTKGDIMKLENFEPTEHLSYYELDKLVDFAREYGVETHDGEKFLEVYEDLQANAPIRSFEEIVDLACELIDVIRNHYGDHLLRLFVRRPLIHTKGYVGFNEVNLYHKTHAGMGHFTKAFMVENDVVRGFDTFYLQHFFKEVYDFMYGYVDPYNDNLWHLLNMVRDHMYEETYVKVLEEDIRTELRISGDKWFVKQDLTNRKTLYEIYKIMKETRESPFKMFTELDGKGNHLYQDGTVALEDFEALWDYDEGL